jgi:hypothetical protein
LIVCDTSGLFAAYNASQPEHREVLVAVEQVQGPLVVNPYVLTELDYLLRTRVGVDAEVGMLRDMATGAFDTVGLTSVDLEQAITLIERYRNRNLGLADAANVVVAAQYRTTHILTLDHRDYRVIRPLWGDAFTILPADRARRR